MPTFESTEEFNRDFDRLSNEEQAAFDRALEKFIPGVDEGDFLGGLRVKPMKRAQGIWEMTWAADGRATFEYGEPVKPDMRHVVWRRIGGHEIFRSP
ncbi:MAG: hypothetical protein ABR529_01090 [Actinomycetota bacterium]